jgi:hypothetical protein
MLFSTKCENNDCQFQVGTLTESVQFATPPFQFLASQDTCVDKKASWWLDQAEPGYELTLNTGCVQKMKAEFWSSFLQPYLGNCCPNSSHEEK